MTFVLTEPAELGDDVAVNATKTAAMARMLKSAKRTIGCLTFFTSGH